MNTTSETSKYYANVVISYLDYAIVADIGVMNAAPD